MTGLFLKDPDAVLDYRIDWAGAIGADVTLAVSEWRVEPAEMGGVVVASHSIAGGETVARLGGGLLGHLYHVGNRVTFSDGTSDERSLLLRVVER